MEVTPAPLSDDEFRMGWDATVNALREAPLPDEAQPDGFTTGDAAALLRHLGDTYPSHYAELFAYTTEQPQAVGGYIAGLLIARGLDGRLTAQRRIDLDAKRLAGIVRMAIHRPNAR